MESDTKAPTPEEYAKAISREIGECVDQIAEEQQRVGEARAAIKRCRERIAELNRMLPRKPRTRKPKKD